MKIGPSCFMLTAEVPNAAPVPQAKKRKGKTQIYKGPRKSKTFNATLSTKTEKQRQ